MAKKKYTATAVRVADQKDGRIGDLLIGETFEISSEGLTDWWILLNFKINEPPASFFWKDNHYSLMAKLIEICPEIANHKMDIHAHLKTFDHNSKLSAYKKARDLLRWNSGENKIIELLDASIQTHTKLSNLDVVKEELAFGR